MTKQPESNLQHVLAARYSDAPALDGTEPNNGLLQKMAARGSCRAFLDQPVPSNWVEMLCAIALASPTKSDLQQRDIVLLQSSEVRQGLAGLVSGQAWIADAPMMAVFCGNNRRQRLLHDWHSIPFANDHLDAFFNATGDAAIAMGAFITAAEALGLGCCPISAVRNEAAAISALLGLPDHVFPFAGLAFGFPAQAPVVSKRLPLRVTCHIDQFTEEKLQNAVIDYDRARAKAQPYTDQRATEIFGKSDRYAWSDDKVRQYSQPEREGFGDYVKARGFKLD
ncbi:nitroreductase family protein [Roseovarius sp. 2305UL8-3]|uniref:nitroreductase family protein n=1 Tax=Roseovarius conchicola TaxID=3121636 RepID=UPI003527D698